MTMNKVTTVGEVRMMLGWEPGPGDDLLFSNRKTEMQKIYIVNLADKVGDVRIITAKYDLMKENTTPMVNLASGGSMIMGTNNYTTLECKQLVPTPPVRHYTAVETDTGLSHPITIQSKKVRINTFGSIVFTSKEEARQATRTYVEAILQRDSKVKEAEEALKKLKNSLLYPKG